MTKPKAQNIGKATLVVMGTLFLSRILGFIREMIVANVYGKGDQTDAFFAAFTIPDVMFNLLVAGALSSGFMPIFTSFLAKDDEDGAWKAANTFITVGIIFILCFNVMGIVFAPYLVPLVAKGLSSKPDTYRLTINLTRVMFSAVTFTVLAGITRGILNSYKRFTAPSIGPVLYNVGIILGAALLGRPFGIYGMAIGVVIGAMMNFGVQFPELLKVGKHRFRLELNTDNKGYKRMLRLMVPAIIGLSISQVNLVVNQNIASVLGKGSISALRFANRIMLLPLGIFAMGISTTIFPTMTSHIARNEVNEYKETFALGLNTVLFVTIPSAVGMMVLNAPIVRLLYRTGKFTEEDVLITATALAFYSIGLIGQSAVQIITRGFYAIQDTRSPVKIGAFTVLINIILNLIFVKTGKLAIGGIALSYSITSIINMVLLYKKLGKRVRKLKTKKTAHTIIKATMASILMGIAASQTSRLIEAKLGIDSKLAQLVDVGFAVGIGILVYIIAAYLLRMKEMEFAFSVIKRKFKKR